MILRNEDEKLKTLELPETDFKRHVELGKRLEKLGSRMRQQLDVVLDKHAKKLYPSKMKDFEKGKKNIEVEFDGMKYDFPRSGDNAFYLEHVLPTLSGGAEQFFLLNNHGVPLAGDLGSLGFSYKISAKENDFKSLQESAQEARELRKKLAKFLEKWSTDGFSLKVSVKDGELVYEQGPPSLDGKAFLAEFDELERQLVK